MGKRNVPNHAIKDPNVNAQNPPMRKAKTLTPEFIDTVHSLFPEQPWKPGLHLTLARQLRCSAWKVAAAINTLVAQGRRYRQADGVVYSADGTILATDPDRVK